MKAEISRRSLMKTSALGSLALASSAFTLPFSQMVRAAEAPVEEKAVWSSCTVNCGSRCLLRLHVKDDTVYWVESDTTGDDVYGNHQVRACLRGRSIRRRMNHPDRLKYPMKRVGKRGEGKFERISWDEALDTISDNLRRKHHQLKRPVPSDELLRWFSQSLWQLQYRTDQCRNELYVRCQ